MKRYFDGLLTKSHSKLQLGIGRNRRPRLQRQVTRMTEQLEVAPDPDALNHLIARYRAEERPFRCCHPRDLLLQIRNQCDYEGRQAVMTRENFDFAMTNYFTIM